LGWWVWLEGARGALSTGGIFKRIGAVLSFRFSVVVKADIEIYEVIILIVRGLRYFTVIRRINPSP
jgi:hypothetical protein